MKSRKEQNVSSFHMSRVHFLKVFQLHETISGIEQHAVFEFVTCLFVTYYLFLFQNAFPLRYKGVHHYNGGPLLEAMFHVMYPFMDKKFRERVSVLQKSLRKKHYLLFTKYT